MANDAHLRLAAQWLSDISEISAPLQTTGARTWMEPSGEELFLHVLDGEGNKCTFSMSYNRDQESWEVGGGY